MSEGNQSLRRESVNLLSGWLDHEKGPSTYEIEGPSPTREVVDPASTRVSPTFIAGPASCDAMTHVYSGQ